MTRVFLIDGSHFKLCLVTRIFLFETSFIIPAFLSVPSTCVLTLTIRYQQQEPKQDKQPRHNNTSLITSTRRGVLSALLNKNCSMKSRVIRSSSKRETTHK